MESQEYNEALKRGEKSYRDALSRGEYPYLQVLDEILSHEPSVASVNLGLTEIPADAIKGTVTAGRRTAFAPNFMPLLAPNTEFAAKWSALCEAHVTEGIHDPVKAYEYMHRYYILEGNKRVSVLKYFDAPTIPATVTRMIPKRTDSPENRAYFEYLDFYKICPVNFLVFTRPGSYQQFLELAEKEPDVPWTEDERMNLKASYARFLQAFRSIPALQGAVEQPGDAYLLYLSVYGYKASLTKMPEEFKAEILKIRDEMLLLGRDDRVQVVTEVGEAPKKNVFERLFSGSGKKLKIAFIYNRPVAVSPWAYGHELGRLYVESVFKDDIETTVYEDVDPETGIDDALEEAVANGANVIFAATRLFMEACLKAAVRHPDVKILCCTLNATHRLIRTYYARIYEAKFLSGIVAGILSRDGRIGYLSDYPIPTNIANINAFALGVRSVNPEGRVYLAWTTEKGADPKAFFEANGVSIISGRELVAPKNAEREFGLYRILPDGSDERLAMPICDWGVLYRRILESIRDGGWEEADKRSGQRAVNYWWGMESHAVDLLLSKHVPEETAKLVRFLRECIRNGSLKPFNGIIKTKTGTVGDDERHVYLPEEIMTIDWLAENIEGHIPAPEELNDAGRTLILLQERNAEAEPLKEDGEPK